jgi:lipid-A-disaccharide synthase
LAGRLLLKVKYLGMPKVLANKGVVREFIQHQAQSREIVTAVEQLLDNPHARQQMIWEFDKIAAMLGESGASDRAAKAILAEIA